jgi:hypothetical protein
MKKLFFGTILLALIIVFPIPMMANAEVDVRIVLPPPIVFAAPPDLIVLPETYIYVVPDVDADIFFFDGWWWRPWEGRWYRSRYYDRGWGYYNDVPGFYFDIDPGWRGYYRNHNWYGHRWDYERIPNQRLQQNWKGWEKSKHWEKQKTWGVQNYQPRPQQQRQELRQQRQQQYQQRPEVRKHQEQQQKQPQVQQPKPQPKEKVERPKQQPIERVQQPKPQPQERVQQPKPQPKEKVERPKQRPIERAQQPKPQHQEPAPQVREGEPQHSQQQQGTHERGEGEKQERK